MSDFPACCSKCRKEFLSIFNTQLPPSLNCYICGVPLCGQCAFEVETVVYCTRHHSGKSELPDELLELVAKFDERQILSNLENHFISREFPWAEALALAQIGASIPEKVLESLAASAVQLDRHRRQSYMELLIELLPEYARYPKWSEIARNQLDRARDEVELWGPNRTDQIYYWTAVFGLHKLDKLLNKIQYSH